MRKCSFSAPNKFRKVTTYQQLTEFSQSWPRWNSRPWIVAGNLNLPANALSYSGPFIHDCRGGGFNLQVKNLLAQFDWALFSYFTTYQGEYFVFVSNISEIDEVLICEKTMSRFRNFSVYPLTEDPVSTLQNATFYDYEKEGLYVYQLARERDESPPFLLCHLLNDDNLYHKWNWEKNRAEKDVWYDGYIEMLEMVSELKTKDGSYLLFRVSDVEGYLSIWGESSEDHSIAVATLSGDSDVAKLEHYLSRARNGYAAIETDLPAFGLWAYYQVYGGGSDEHHALFRSRSAKVTQQLWQDLGDSQISRF